MRFSLTTLLIAALWFASLGLVIFYCHPWQLVTLERFNWSRPPLRDDLYEGLAHAPDGRRSIMYDAGEVCLSVDRIHAYKFVYGTANSMVANRFLDNDTLEIFLDKDNNPYGYNRAIYKRRFPEWWWGHFYRPEVWLLLALTIVLVVRAIKHRRATRMQRAEVAT